MFKQFVVPVAVSQQKPLVGLQTVMPVTIAQSLAVHFGHSTPTVGSVVDFVKQA